MINIYKQLIKNYINILTINDIKSYTLSKNTTLSDKEAKIIYDFIKTNYNNLLDKDDTSIKQLQNKLNPNLYNKILNLYNENKTKYLT